MKSYEKFKAAKESGQKQIFEANKTKQAAQLEEPNILYKEHGFTATIFHDALAKGIPMK